MNFSRRELDLAVAAEREACAKMLDEAAFNLRGTQKRINQVDAHVVEVLQRQAAAIRARGEAPAADNWQERAAAAFAKDYKEGA